MATQLQIDVSSSAAAATLHAWMSPRRLSEQGDAGDSRSDVLDLLVLSDGPRRTSMRPASGLTDGTVVASSRFRPVTGQCQFDEDHPARCIGVQVYRALLVIFEKSLRLL